MPKYASLPILLLLLSACTTGAVGWGQTHEVTFANEKAITVTYDPVVGGRKPAMQAAQDHCAKYKKTAVPTETVKEDMYKIITTQTFECR